MSRRQRVYVSGPLSSSGDRKENVRLAMAAGLELVKAGFAPFVPHYTDALDPTDSLGHATWIDVDLPWVLVSDAVLRLPGISKGADQECGLAREYHIPVYTSTAELIANPPARGDDRFHDLLTKLGHLHAKKGADYGRGADVLANVRSSEDFGIPAYLGVLIRMNDKVIRIKNHCKRGRLENESVFDSLIDLSAYALIAHILLEEHDRRKKVQHLQGV